VAEGWVSGAVTHGGNARMAAMRISATARTHRRARLMAGTIATFVHLEGSGNSGSAPKGVRVHCREFSRFCRREVREVKDELFEKRFRHNMKRVGDLTKLVYGKTAPYGAEGFDIDGVGADICRAVVVFMHAAFEDMLRTVARDRIPQHATFDYLKGVPLPGSSPGKFFLGDLNGFRDKTVAELIQQSVADHLDRESFSSCTMVDVLLRQMGLDPERFKPLYSNLDAMMKRRHKIVHEADLVGPDESETVKWTIVDHVLLMIWNMHVLIFHAQLCVSIDPADAFMVWTLERRQAALAKIREGFSFLISLPREPEALLAGMGNVTQRLDEAKSLLEPSKEDVEAFVRRQEEARSGSVTALGGTSNLTEGQE